MKKLTNKADSRLYIMVPDEMLKEASYAYKINGDVYPVDDWVLSDVKEEKESTFAEKWKFMENWADEDEDNRTIVMIVEDKEEANTIFFSLGRSQNVIKALSQLIASDGGFRNIVHEALEASASCEKENCEKKGCEKGASAKKEPHIKGMGRIIDNKVMENCYAVILEGKKGEGERKSAFSEQLEPHFSALEQIAAEDKDNRVVIAVGDDKTGDNVYYTLKGNDENIIAALAHLLNSSERFRYCVTEACKTYMLASVLKKL